MATSGKLQLATATYNSDTWKFYFNWERANVDVENNASVIRWTLTCEATAAGELRPPQRLSIGSSNTSVALNHYNITDYVSVSVGTTTLLTGSTSIPHDGGGSQGFRVRLRNTDGTNGYVDDSTGFSVTIIYAGYQTDTLDYIVRSAYITSYPTNWTDEDSPTITYSNPAGNYATQLQACISFAGEDDIAYRDIPKTGTSYTFNFTDEEKAILWEKLYNDGYTSGMYFYVRSRVPTIDNSTYETVWDRKTTTVQLINYMPTLNPTVVDNDSDVTGNTGDPNTFVAGMSDAYFETGAEAHKGATIVKQYISNGDQQVDNASSGTLTDVTSNTFYFYVEDSRGNVTRDFKVVNWIDYVKPTCKVKAENVTANGDLTFHLSGKYFNGSFGDRTNELVADYKVYKDGEEAPDGWFIEILNTTVDTDNNYTASFTITGLEYNQRYQFVMRVIDNLATSAETIGIVAAEPLFDWGKEDFRFYIPVQMDEGFTYPQTVLWSGVSKLGEGEVIPLDKPISSQPTGIVLVFSLYRNDAAEDASITTFFKSRAEIQYLMPNGKHTFLMAINSNLSVFGAKYITIEDDKLTGFEGNTNSGTASGITFNNDSFVLRYVIGV